MGRYDIFRYMDNFFDNMIVNNYIPTTFYYDQGSVVKDGIKTYYDKGKVSRLGGPAIIYDDDREDEYWVDGKKISKEDHDKLLQEYEDNKIHTIYIDGITKEVTGKKLKLINELLKTD